MRIYPTRNYGESVSVWELIYRFLILILIGVVFCTQVYTEDVQDKDEPSVPLEYRTKVIKALSVAGENKPELIQALSIVPVDHLPALAFLVSQTGYRYFFPEMDRKISDATTITADLLLTHIKLGYEARQTFPWSTNLDDDTFRRFVLSYRTTTEKLIDWRTYFWNHTELRPLVDEYAKRINGKDIKEADQIFKEMLFKINTEWVGKNVPYAPRGMPDMNPIEAINAKTGRCTDQTNTLIAILRTFGIAATGVRVVWWPEQNDNHNWTAVYDPFTKEWLDIDSGQDGSSTDPEYFRRFIRHKEKKAAKIYWVYPGEEGGETFRNLSLKGDEAYPPSIEKYLIAKPMVDKTERYNDVADLKQSNIPADSLIWLAVFNSNMWRPVAGVRSTNDGTVVFPKVGCEIRYRLMSWNNNTPAYCSEILILHPDGSVETKKADPRDDMPLLQQKAFQLLETRKLKEAKEVFVNLLELNPGDRNTLYNLACVCSLMGDKAEALDYLEKSIAAGWDNFEHIKSDTDLDNIRNEPRYMKLIKAMGFYDFSGLKYPAERTELFYALVVSKATKADADWAKVVDAFTKKYKARVFIYEGEDPDAVMKELINYAPKYVAFIAKPTEATGEFVLKTRAMMCAIDEDPYEDAIWGIITGYNYEDCLRMAKADKLVIKKALSGVGDGWLQYFNEGLAFNEGEKNAMYTKKPGKPLEKQLGPDDTTKSFVDALNTNEYQMMSSSGHATEHDWQIGYNYRNGQIRSTAGKLFGINTEIRIYPIQTTNSKIYYSPGNCFIGHISDMDCMALAWIHNGVNQYFGHTKPQGRPCFAWYIVNYFMALQGQFTFSESVYIHRAAAYWTKAETVCCGSTVLYGDPAWEARLAKEIEPPYTQSLTFNKKDKQVTITFKIDFNQDYKGQPAAAFLPELIRNPETKSVSPKLEVLAIDNLIMVDVGERKKGDCVEAVVTAELLPLKKDNAGK